MLSGSGAENLEASVLTILALIFSIGAVLAYLLQRFHLPTFLAFILTGILLGPNALNLVQINEIQTMAQIGIIFLLFIVGLDLSVDKLRQLRYQAPLAGILQLGLTTLMLTLALRYIAAFPWQLAFLLGSILSLSSTAIVLKSLEEHREMDSDHGRLILGVLIIQDLSIIPLMALVPSLTQPFNPNTALELGWTLGKALVFGAIAVGVSLKLVPAFLDRLASTNKKEVFTLALVCTGLGMAVITNLLGLSYEAGAFVAGLSLSRSLFCRQIISDSKAFRDVFITLFFVSMGLLFDINFLVKHIWLVAVVTLFLILLKAACAFAAVRVLKFPNRTALWAGLSLFQVGEFSFVLLGRTLDTVSHVPDWEKLLGFWNPLLINAIIISMFLTPLVLRGLHRMTAPYLRARLKKAEGTLGALEEWEEPTNQVIIAGYGPIARNLATALAEKEIPYTIVEMNLKTIRKLKAKGVSCLYGDISRPEILVGAGIAKSNILVITFPDTRTAESTIQLARQLNPRIYSMVRSRYRVDVDRLHRIGVNSVIYEEFETSISFIFNIMNHMQYPILETDRLIAKVRSLENKVHQEMTTSKHPVFGRLSLLEGTQIEWIEVGSECALIGKSLKDAKIRQKTGVNVIAVIQAADQSQVAADPELLISAQDVFVALGNLSQLQALESLLYK